MGERIIYGVNPVLDALKHSGGSITRLVISRDLKGRVSSELRALAGKGRLPVEESDRRGLERLTGTPKNQGVAVVLKGDFRYSDLEDILESVKGEGEGAFLLLLDSVQDPGNLGSLIRSAHVAGLHGVVIPKDRAAEVTPTVVKASAGATEHIPIAKVTNLSRAIDKIKEAGIWVGGLDGDRGEDIYKVNLKGPLAIVVGSEGSGLKRIVRESCDFLLSIPMSGALGSLNAAVAGAVAIFEARRQRG